MANAERLPSGSYRTQVTKTINGKKVKRSFTVHPRECGGSDLKAQKRSELLALEWQLEAEDMKNGRLTVKQALDIYINDRGVLSPSTLSGYKRTAKGLSDIYDIYIEDVDAPLLQKLITGWCEPEKVGKDPNKKIKKKTAKNRLSLLKSALKYSKVDTKFELAYGANDSKKVKSPDTDTVKAMLDAASDELRPILFLAAFGSLRRSEICGLKHKDILKELSTISVNGAVVESDTDGNKWVYKDYLKTDRSRRVVKLPDFVFNALPKAEDPEDPEEFLFKISPTAITSRVERLSAKLGLKHTLHSFRHYAASFRSDLNIPRKYIEEVGGWDDNSKILTTHYDNALCSSRKKYNDIANKFIEENFNDTSQD